MEHTHVRHTQTFLLIHYIIITLFLIIITIIHIVSGGSSTHIDDTHGIIIGYILLIHAFFSLTNVLLPRIIGVISLSPRFSAGSIYLYSCALFFLIIGYALRALNLPIQVHTAAYIPLHLGFALITLLTVLYIIRFSQLLQLAESTWMDGLQLFILQALIWFLVGSLWCWYSIATESGIFSGMVSSVRVSPYIPALAAWNTALLSVIFGHIGWIVLHYISPSEKDRSQWSLTNSMVFLAGLLMVSAALLHTASINTTPSLLVMILYSASLALYTGMTIHFIIRLRFPNILSLSAGTGKNTIQRWFIFSALMSIPFLASFTIPILLSSTAVLSGMHQYHLFFCIITGSTAFFLLSGSILPLITGRQFHFPDLFPINFYLFIAAAVFLIINAYYTDMVTDYPLWYALSFSGVIIAALLLGFNCLHTLLLKPPRTPVLNEDENQMKLNL